MVTKHADPHRGLRVGDYVPQGGREPGHVIVGFCADGVVGRSLDDAGPGTEFLVGISYTDVLRRRSRKVAA